MGSLSHQPICLMAASSLVIFTFHWLLTTIRHLPVGVPNRVFRECCAIIAPAVLHGAEVFDFGANDGFPKVFDLVESAKLLCGFFCLVGVEQFLGFFAEPCNFVVDHAFAGLAIGFSDSCAHCKVGAGFVLGGDAGDVDTVGFNGPQERGFYAACVVATAFVVVVEAGHVGFKVG